VLASRPVEEAAGLSVTVVFPRFIFTDPGFRFAHLAIALAAKGERYAGFSQPAWYSPEALCQLLAAAPQGTPLARVIEDAFGIAGTEPDLSVDWAARFLDEHASGATAIGHLGKDALAGRYAKAEGMANLDDAHIPFCVEAWISAETAERDEETSFWFYPLLNRSPSLARLIYHSDSAGLRLDGCGLDVKISGVKRAHYTVRLSLITPYLQLMTDGKTPFLGPFEKVIVEVVKSAAREAYRLLARPPASMSIADAARESPGWRFPFRLPSPTGDPISPPAPAPRLGNWHRDRDEAWRSGSAALSTAYGLTGIALRCVS
jgi:hypothetical protein